MKIKIPERVVDWLITRAQRTPYFHLQGYMERWWLRKPPGHGQHSDDRNKDRDGVGIRIHHILRSDDDRALHDHPWWNVSVVLRGGYWEVMPVHDMPPAIQRIVWRGPGSIVFRKATDRHRLVLPEGTTAWSLFIMGKWERDWGFHTESGWRYWRDYLGVPSDTDTTTG